MDYNIGILYMVLWWIRLDYVILLYIICYYSLCRDVMSYSFVYCSIAGLLRILLLLLVVVVVVVVVVVHIYIYIHMCYYYYLLLLLLLWIPFGDHPLKLERYRED